MNVNKLDPEIKNIFLNSNTYKRIASYINSLKHSYSENEKSLILDYCVTTFWMFYRSWGTYHHSFLLKWYLKYPEIFSFCDLPNLYSDKKFLLFMRNNRCEEAKSIIDNFGVKYSHQELSVDKANLSLFIFIENYPSAEDFKHQLVEKVTVPQTIQRYLEKNNGIECTLLLIDGGLIAVKSSGNAFNIFNPASKHNTEAYIRKDLNKLFRSSWEANIARILNYKNINFEYEKETFEFEPFKMYLPDFFLQNNVILEVKGYWDKCSVDKVDSFIRNAKDYTLYVVDFDTYHELDLLYNKFHPLDFWENSSKKDYSIQMAVVGLPFVKDKTVFDDIAVGDKLQFEREPYNTFDKYAIAVKTLNGKMIGHLEKAFASIYSQKIRMGMQFDIVIKEIKSNAIIIDVKRNNFDNVVVWDFLRPNYID